jgi:hypothetical protein
VNSTLCLELNIGKLVIRLEYVQIHLEDQILHRLFSSPTKSDPVNKIAPFRVQLASSIKGHPTLSALLSVAWVRSLPNYPFKDLLLTRSKEHQTWRTSFLGTHDLNGTDQNLSENA